MNLLVSFPGGSQLFVIIVFVLLIFYVPVLAVYYYLKSKKLSGELSRILEEKKILDSENYKNSLKLAS